MTWHATEPGNLNSESDGESDWRLGGVLCWGFA